LALASVESVHVAVYIEPLPLREKDLLSHLSVKQHLAAIRMLFNWLLTGQVVPDNPAASVHRLKHAVRKGKMPVLTAEDAGKLLDSIAPKRVLEPESGE
jgi:site-specific recombinase XerD